MKIRTTLLIALLSLFSIACKKAGNDPKPQEEDKSTVLLSKVISNTASDPFHNQPLAEFFYNGKIISKALIYYYGFYLDIATHEFKYAANGHVEQVTVTHTTDPGKNTKVEFTYNGDNISEMKTFDVDKNLISDVKVIYQNGHLTEWAEQNRYKVNYTYDATGANTKQTYTDYQNFIPGGEITTYNYQGFDNKKSVNAALPMWLYFRAYNKLSYLYFANSGSNALKSNIVNFVNNSYTLNYNYTYTESSYPASITWDNLTYPEPTSYKYEYIKVK
jgi:hypothetical protein